MSAKTIEAARIAGALKGLDALRQMQQSAENDEPDDTSAKFYAQVQANVQAMVAAIGPMTPEQEGAFAVLAEYIHSEISGITPSIELGSWWLPQSAMTDEERLAMVAEAQADRDATFSRQCNVISIADRRPAQ